MPAATATSGVSAMPTIPPSSVSTRASARNWTRMWRRRAPSARRRPISRMRSSTETSMMFITPTPPIPRVSAPMNTSSTCRPMVMPSMMGRNSSRPNIWIARLSVGEKRWRLPMAARTCSMACGSNIGATAEKTKVAA